MEYFTQAIVLGHSDVKEYDRLFSLYTKHLGKTKVIGRGIRRGGSKMAGQMEPFALLAVKIVSGRGTNRLSNVETVERYQDVIKNLETIKSAGSCLALVDRLVKEGSCDLGILKLLNQVLLALDSSDRQLDDKKFLASVFQLQLLSHLGYRPELSNCVACREKIQPTGNVFDFIKGGLICLGCCQKQSGLKSGLAVSQEQIKILRLILEKDFNFFLDKKVSSDLAKTVSKIINGFVAVVGED